MSYRELFIGGPLVAWLLTVVLFVLRERLSARAKIAWTVFLFASLTKFLCFTLLGQHYSSPDLPAGLIWTWDFFYSGAMILFALSLVCPFRFKGKLWLLPLVAWGLSGWGLYEGVRIPDVREIELGFADLPESLDGYRIVQLSDLHCSCAARRWRTQAVVDRANALGADLICVTGDNSDGTVDRVAPFLEPIRELRAKDGVYACLGNHELYHNFPDWNARFYSQTTNICFLTDACAFPRRDLALGGADVLSVDLSIFDAATNGEFRILMMHMPNRARVNLRDMRVRLQLSGHTHGGIAPIFRGIIAKKNGGFVHGLYPIGDGVLYVCPGCGQWAGFPMRIMNPSEITLITLRRDRKGKR